MVETRILQEADKQAMPMQYTHQKGTRLKVKLHVNHTCEIPAGKVITYEQDALVQDRRGVKTSMISSSEVMHMSKIDTCSLSSSALTRKVALQYICKLGQNRDQEQPYKPPVRPVRTRAGRTRMEICRLKRAGVVAPFPHKL